jgi:serine/threonine-protein kinase
VVEAGTIIGKLRVERVIGRGGMGTVAIATHIQLDQRVAIKIAHDEVASDPAFVERFMREARACARLRSEHVCRVSDVGQLESGAPYFVMELLEGSDLASVIAHRPLAIEVAADYMLQVCTGLAEAHALGIVHRDLKPSNLFVTKRLDGSPLIKVLDFGIAKAPTAASELELTRTATVLGSPRYMSPEQLRSPRDVDARADIWALGAILYEMVSGRVPFPAISITELSVMIAVDAPKPLDVEPEFLRVVLRCLEKSADRRYPDVAALAADLVAFAPRGTRRGALIEKLSRRQTQDPEPAPVRIDPLAPTAASIALVPDSTTLGGASGAMPARPKRTRLRLRLAIAGLGATAAAIAGVVTLSSGERSPNVSTMAPRDAPPLTQPADATIVVPDAPVVSVATDAPAPPKSREPLVVSQAPVDDAQRLHTQFAKAVADKQWTPAIVIARRLIRMGKLEPSDPDYVNAAEGYVVSRRALLEPGGNCDKMAAIADESFKVKADPPSAVLVGKCYSASAYRSWHSEKLADALADARKALEHDKDNKQALWLAASCLCKLDRDLEANDYIARLPTTGVEVGLAKHDCRKR